MPAFRAQYNQIYNDLICGPWSRATLVAFLDAVEPVLTTALANDLNNQFDPGGEPDPVADRFDSLRNWVTQRVANVTGQIEGFEACPTVQLLLNEVLASNATGLEDPDEPGEFPDWFEILNPGLSEVEVGGIYLTDDPLDPTKYQIPAGVTIPAQGYLLMYAGDDGTQGPQHTNFKLSAAGESVSIVDRDALSVLDSVSFGPQSTDVAYGRFPDGVGSWDFIATPTPGASNAPHNSPPIIADMQRDIERPTSSDVVVVSAAVSDDSAVVSVTLHYDVGGGDVPVAMLDDGLSGDGGVGDGVYGASILAFGDDTVVDYWVSALDDLGGTRVDPPSAPVFPRVYVVGYTPPPLVINEFMADNDSVISDPDETLAFEDWIEIYNASGQPVLLDGMYMTDSLLTPTSYPLPAGLVVPAQGHLLLWADQEPFQGITHLGFRLAMSGEQIGLFDTDARGNIPIDTLSYGLQSVDIAEGRCPDGFDAFQSFVDASPGALNLGSAACPDGALVSLFGVAQGGQVSVTIDGTLIVVTTAPGDSAEDVARALAQAINDNATLAAAGVTASLLGSEVSTNGTLDSLVISDSGISTEPTATTAVPALGPAAMGVLLLLLAATGLCAARFGGFGDARAARRA